MTTCAEYRKNAGKYEPLGEEAEAATPAEAEGELGAGTGPSHQTVTTATAIEGGHAYHSILYTDPVLQYCI